MDDRNNAGSPLEAAAGTVGERTTETFDLLSNETRLAVLVALWEAYEPHGESHSVSFSELRERVRAVDSGRFNYHLGKMKGRLVQATEDGYRLHPLGLSLVQAVIAGTGDEASLAPTEVDFPCHICGRTTTVDYESGWLSHACTECEGGFEDPDRAGSLLFTEPFPSAGLSGRDPEAVFAAGVFQLLQVFGMKLGGVCPTCAGVVDAETTVCERHDPEPGELCDDCRRSSPVAIKWRCTVCKYRGSTSPSGTLALQPDAVAFYHDHGIDLGYAVNDFDRAREVLRLVRAAEEEVLSTDPLRVRVTTRVGDDTLSLTLDERFHAVRAGGES